MAVCGSFTYTAINSDLSPIDNTVLVFTSSIPKIDVYSTDYTKAGVYSIVISGYQGPYTSNVASITISLTIVDPCLTAIYSTTAVPN